MARRTRRLILVLGGLVLIAGATALVLTALRGNIVYFFAPSDLSARPVAEGRRIRLGGLVETGSVQHGADNAVAFIVTDGQGQVPVRYHGLLPDLFREGQGVVAEGKLDKGGTFQADTILAKHDERYMPREVADALKKAGTWRPRAEARP